MFCFSLLYASKELNLEKDSESLNLFREQKIKKAANLKALITIQTRFRFLHFECGKVILWCCYSLGKVVTIFVCRKYYEIRLGIGVTCISYEPLSKHGGPCTNNLNSGQIKK